MRAAIISAGVVTRVILVNTLAEFPGAIDGTNADVGDLWNGTVFSKPAQTFNQVRASKKDEITSRWATARGAGYLFQAKRIATDALSSSQISLIGARSRRAKDDTEAFSMIWVCADESTLNLSRAELLDLEKAYGDHLKACSDNARTLRQALGAAVTVADIAAIDANAGWPA